MIAVANAITSPSRDVIKSDMFVLGVPFGSSSEGESSYSYAQVYLAISPVVKQPTAKALDLAARRPAAARGFDITPIRRHCQYCHSRQTLLIALIRPLATLD